MRVMKVKPFLWSEIRPLIEDGASLISLEETFKTIGTVEIFLTAHAQLQIASGECVKFNLSEYAAERLSSYADD